jgi:hypothetical protein
MPEFRRCGELYRLFRLDSVGVAMCANDFGDDFWSKSKEERQLYLFGATQFLGDPLLVTFYFVQERYQATTRVTKRATTRFYQ